MNDILDISRIELGAVRLNNNPFKIRELVEKVMTMFIVNAKSKKISLEYNVDDEVPTELLGDQSRLGQILINLIGNAVKFTEQGGVEISVSFAGKKAGKTCLCFKVADTGIGIAEKDMSKLFKSFSQVDDSNQRKYGGTGLGLAISRNLVEMMDGEISVESEPGEGSMFTFYIWLSDMEAASVEDRHEEAVCCEKVNAVENTRILVVEDNKVNQVITRELLEKKGYEVSVADNGFMALEILSKLSFDLVVMDIQMPEMDGLEATKALRSKGDGTPIIAVTAYAMNNDRQKCFEVGMDEYLSKPFTVEELYSKIETVLVRKQQAV